MRTANLLFLISLIATLFAAFSSAQTDELRNATGLPIPIGEPVIYGRVMVRGIGPRDRRPRIHVGLFIGGVQTDRREANDEGYYYFLTMPRNGAKLVFEVDEVEVGRAILIPGLGNTARHDITVDWQAFKKDSAKPGVISAGSGYPRSPENEKLFQQAVAALNEKRTEEARLIFNRIVTSDPKDFISWTEIGIIHSQGSKFAEAEAAYTKALEQKPDYMAALMNLGKVHLAQKQYENAIAVFVNAVTADPNSANAHHLLGESYLQAKLGSKAVPALNEAIRLAPNEKVELHLRLAALYNAAGVKDRAANEYKLFLEKRPNHPDREKLEKYISENQK